MTQAPQISFLPDKRRLHLHHGPIDMIVDVKGPGRDAALRRAAIRFDTLLDELVADLDRLRKQDGPDPTTMPARHMVKAVVPFAPRFITPMAAVAGAGADTMLAAICDGPGVMKAYVNNGGDIAFHLSGGETVTVAVGSAAPAQINVCADDPVKGIATSGWQGRSASRGIADAVTVLATSGAGADAAATMIANAVDLPGHPGIKREPANDLSPDSDLGCRLVTCSVGPLCNADIETALTAGSCYAQTLVEKGLITGAYLTLQGRSRAVGLLPLVQQKVLHHA